jgi:porphobilinogen synthase
MITGKYPSLRLRRNRKYDWTRRLVQENTLSSSDFILPIFLIDGKNKKEKIPSMPDVYRYTIDRISQIIDKAIKNKVPMVALFPKTKQTKKNELGTEALNEDNLVCKAILQIKKKYKNEIGIMCDVALDPYTSHGHDGLIKNNEIINDETIDVLVNQSLLQAKIGCDVLAPSDMMDGRIKKIRSALDNEGLKNINILSYAAKYASSYYGPFRDAVGSKGSLKGDKKTYQMDFRNTDEALREISLDIKEGADMVMVKPGMPYLDIIKSIKEKFRIPVFAYQVSGEYSLLSNAIIRKLLTRMQYTKA